MPAIPGLWEAETGGASVLSLPRLQSNLRRPLLKIKDFNEGKGCGSVVKYLTNTHEKAQASVSSNKTNQ